LNLTEANNEHQQGLKIGTNGGTRMKIMMISGLTVLLMAPGLFSQELTGEDIIEKVNELMNVDSVQAKAKMTILTTSGKTRTFIYESWSKDKGEKNLVRYLEPRRVKGLATLMLNHADDIWMFYPRTQRVRKLASHAKKQKMQGSDFSYEDMGSGDAFIKEFSSKRLKNEKMEGHDCYTLELIRKPDSDTSYSRLILWVLKENFYPLVIDYYDEDDTTFLLKRLIQSDIRVIDNIPTAMKVVMYNKQDNTKTEMELLEVKYNVKLDDSMFTERGLKK
jgi:outer membrane lipoprotein-sorting protein